jgi:hypothetical protein
LSPARLATGKVLRNLGPSNFNPPFPVKFVFKFLRSCLTVTPPPAVNILLSFPVLLFSLIGCARRGGQNSIGGSDRMYVEEIAVGVRIKKEAPVKAVSS